MAKTVEQLLEELRQDPRFLPGVSAWHHFPHKEGKYQDIPSSLHKSLIIALNAKGITQLYSHQRQSFDLVSSGKSICVVTPTASGKTLCYNLPVLDGIFKDGSSKALYLFPTKALAQDQLAELTDLTSKAKVNIHSFTFDGDTPGKRRRLAKEVGQIIFTNPDMLHQAILPHHTTWVNLFQSLKYIVIDEMHGYRGVFGSHVANVIRRLKRICYFYGSDPRFILCSATIANPKELAEHLTETTVEIIDENGSPAPWKDFIFFNPPPLSPDGTIRQSSIEAASRLSSKFISNHIQTIVFAKSRMSVELMVQYLRNAFPKMFEKDRIEGYRGGYLPNERRDIEKRLRSGEILGVVATNALELGIDIGHLDCSIMAGYPGTIASTWQQAGRSGRRRGKAVAILIAGSSPLDQFIIKTPAYFFDQSPEHALINPDNPYILGEHIKCAAYELPFSKDEGKTKLGEAHAEPFLEQLEKQNILYFSSSRWNWSSNSFPAAGISLRSASNENFVVIDTTRETKVIGEVDWASAPLLIHEGAIYIHKGIQYHVNYLDYSAKKAYVKQVDVDYYTDANLAVGVKVISVEKIFHDLPVTPHYGELSVTALATIYKKIKLYTNENVGSGEITLPEMNMHTQGMWFSLPQEITSSLDVHYVGPVLSGIASIASNIAPLFLMCDKQDIGVAVEVRSAFDGKPTVYFYDSYPGGVGLSERLFNLLPNLLTLSLKLISSCGCAKGCPGCIGPVWETGEGVKEMCLSVLKQLNI